MIRTNDLLSTWDIEVTQLIYSCDSAKHIMPSVVYTVYRKAHRYAGSILQGLKNSRIVLLLLYVKLASSRGETRVVLLDSGTNQIRRSHVKKQHTHTTDAISPSVSFSLSLIDRW